MITRIAILLNVPSLVLAYLAFCCLATPRDGSSHEAIAIAFLAFAFKAFKAPDKEWLPVAAPDANINQPQAQPWAPAQEN